MTETSSIGVTPGFQELSLRPGETYHGTFKVVNPNPDHSNTVDYKIFSSPFFISDENYSVSFEIENDFTQISKWITVDSPSGSVSGEEVQEIPFTITIPDDAPGGGQYCALITRIIDKENNDDGFSVKANHQVASIIYAKIDGETKKTGEIIENKINGFSMDSPISASSSVKNSGNVHLDVNYTLEVYPLFSDEIIYSTEENPKTNSALPGTTLTSFNVWEETPKLGIFRVVQKVSFLDNSSAVEKTVFVFPLWFLTIWLVFILGGIFLIIGRSFARKKNKKHAKKYSGPRISR